MIKANELRIGNLVNWKGAPRVVEIIHRESVYLNGSKVCCYLLEDIVPIPLTPEILEKCGFECFDGGANHKEALFALNIEHSGYYLENLESMNIGIAMKYLHQLQNCFFIITGEELPVNL